MSSLFLLGPDPNGQCCGCETRMDPCDSCTGSNSGGCFCFLPIPGIASTGINIAFTMLSGAQYEITQRTSNCVTWGILNGGDVLSPDPSLSILDTFTGVASTTSLALTGLGHINFDPLVSLYGMALSFYSSITVPDSTILSLAYNVTGYPLNPFSAQGVVSLYVYPCQNEGSTDITFTRSYREGAIGTTTLPTTGSLSAGTYQIGFSVGWQGDPSILADMYIGANAYISLSKPVVVNPVVAFYNEPSDTQLQIEACPRFILPTFVDHSIWYPDLATAQQILSSLPIYSSATDFFQAVSCIGQASFSLIGTSYSVSASDTNILASWDETSPHGDISAGGGIEVAFYLIAGQSISLSATYSVTGPVGTVFFSTILRAVMTLRDGENGDLIQIDSNINTPLGGTIAGSLNISFTATESKIYVISASTSVGHNSQTSNIPKSANGSISCDITLPAGVSALPLQALYDLDLDCPARLDCS